MMMMSLQLPDLLSFCSPFELQTINAHCHGVSQASAKWLLESGVALSSIEWRAAKPGLLAAACHPTADLTQLRFVTDFLSLLLYHRERPVTVSQVETFGDGLEGVRTFKLLSDRLARAAARHPSWHARFLASHRAYLAARHRAATRASAGGGGVTAALPVFQSYIEQRRDASGWRMALDMVQLAGDTPVPETFLGEAACVRLHEHACDIAVSCEDIVACAKGAPRTSDLGLNLDLVCVLMQVRHVPLECAVTAAGTLVKQSVEAFLATEKALLSVPEYAGDREVRRYLRGVRDWVAGFVNWLYETQLYLGDKGGEVRAFGWVFVPVLV